MTSGNVKNGCMRLLVQTAIIITSEITVVQVLCRPPSSFKGLFRGWNVHDFVESFLNVLYPAIGINGSTVRGPVRWTHGFSTMKNCWLQK